MKILKANMLDWVGFSGQDNLGLIKKIFFKKV